MTDVASNRVKPVMSHLEGTDPGTKLYLPTSTARDTNPRPRPPPVQPPELGHEREGPEVSPGRTWAVSTRSSSKATDSFQRVDDFMRKVLPNSHFWNTRPEAFTSLKYSHIASPLA